MSDALRMISSLDSSVEQDIYVSRLSAELGIEKSAILEDLRKLNRKKSGDVARKQFTELTDNLTGRKDKVNTEKSANTRAAKAEEMLIAFLVYNNDMAPVAKSKLPPEGFVTKFNAQLYSYVLSKIEEGVNPCDTVTRDFTADEASRFFAITNDYNSQIATKDAMYEYIDTIISEKEKLTPDKISDMSPEDIMDMLRRKKKT